MSLTRSSILLCALLNVASALAAILAFLCGHSSAAEMPNILLIYSDDHGWADLGAQGVDKDIRTPNLDQLARDGVRFTRGYVSAPQCVPSRAGVITGRYQQRFGVEDNNKGPLPLAELTIAERLKPAGYLSGFVGKNHLNIGGSKGAAKSVRFLPDHLPHRQGFDEYFSGEMRQFHASHALDGAPLPDAPQVIRDERFRVVVQTEAALSFLARRAAKPEQPWFLYLAWYAPHVPLESPEPWFSKTPAHLPKERRQALAMIAAMDDGLGQIRAKLRDMGQERNTLLFFIGDNGAPVKPGAWDGSVNAPLIGEKGMLTDGGVRVPFLAAWPAKIPAGQTFEHPVINLDVAATAVKAAGGSLRGSAAAPEDAAKAAAALDGVNLLPFLTGENKSAPHDALYWRWRSQAAVLEFPWKLIQLGNHERFLFDVTNPDGELAVNNRLAQHPDIAVRLEAKLKAWSATLQPPGPPEPNNDQDNGFYADHVAKTAASRPKSRGKGKGAHAPAADDPLQGWICRNGTLSVRDGALVITPDAGAKGHPFFSRAALDLPGPVTVTLRTRATTGGKSTASWRTQGQPDFTAGQSTTFDWPAGADWHEVKFELPAQGRLLHLRLTPAKSATGLQLRSIELRGGKGKVQTFHFSATALADVETVTAPADWREWPLDPSDRPDRADVRNRIDPATVPAIAAFPGAQGHGALAVGGRGGRVIKVTTLAAKGPGSLDEALNAKGPRIVVFDVSGVIRGNFVISEPNITVAGQTAPGAGITIEGTLYTRFAKAPNVGNVILRFLRVRVPPTPPMSTETLDGVRILGADRAIVDHVSAAWAADETTGSPESVNVTYQWCSVEESAIVGHREGLHNYGMKGAGYPWGFIHHNLMAHHSNRNPSATAHVVNNVAYDFRRGPVMDQAPPPPDLYYASSVIGNYYKAGPSEPNIQPMLLKKDTAYFIADSFIHGTGLIRDPWRDADKHAGLKLIATLGKRLSRPRPYPHFPITIHPPERAYELVLAHAGCLPRDRVSRRTVEEVKAGTGKWGRNAPDKPTDEWFLEGLQPARPLPDTDADGMPDAWETSHRLNPGDASDANRIVPRGLTADDRHSGYTFIEHYINDLADRLVLKAMQEANVTPELPGAPR